MAIVNLLSLLFMTCSLVSGSNVYNVLDYGAKGDNTTDDSKAFQDAWKAACGDQQSPTLLIPASKIFLLSQAKFQGPCKSGIHVQLEDSSKIVARNKIWTDDEFAHWIIFDQINNLTMDGSGSLDGQGSIWWEYIIQNKIGHLAPTMLSIMHSQGVTIRGLNLTNSPGKHLVIYLCVDVHIDSLNITAPKESPNTDGVFIDESQQVKVINSTIGTGDDCITIGKDTTNVTISQITCGPGHGISIGSLGVDHSSATVENIYVQNCTLFDTMTGVRIKTWQGGSGHAKNISFDEITLDSVDHPIVIDQFYCNGAHNCKNQTSAVKVSDVSFTNVKGTARKKVAVSLACSSTVPCTGITMRNISITHVPALAQVGSYCWNAHGNKSYVIAPDLPCLAAFNFSKIH